MEQSNYNLFQLAQYVFGRQMIFNEEFLWILLYRLLELVAVPHLQGLFVGGIHPPSIYFSCGKVEFRKCTGFPVDAYFLPKNRNDSAFVDIFALGRSMLCVVSDFASYYSQSLNTVIDWMQCESIVKKATVKDILDYINSSISLRKMDELLAIQENYAILYQKYSIELSNYQERVKRERAVLDQKLLALYDMECEFMYHYPFNINTIVNDNKK